MIMILMSVLCVKGFGLFHFILFFVWLLNWKKNPSGKKASVDVCLSASVCVCACDFFFRSKKKQFNHDDNQSIKFQMDHIIVHFLWISSIHCSIISDQQRSSDEDFNEESNVDDDDDSDHLYSTINCKVNEKQNKKNFHYYSPFDYSNSFYCFSINRWINKFRLVINTIM